MNAKQTDIEYHHKGGIASKEDLHTLAQAAISFTEGLFCYLDKSGERETIRTEGSIRSLLVNAHDPYLAYLDYCQQLIRGQYAAKDDLFKQWKAVAEAILDSIEDPGRESFEYWMRWFRQRRADRELAIYLAALSLTHAKAS